jgi:hypothetical protein
MFYIIQDIPILGGYLHGSTFIIVFFLSIVASVFKCDCGFGCEIKIHVGDH